MSQLHGCSEGEDIIKRMSREDEVLLFLYQSVRVATKTNVIPKKAGQYGGRRVLTPYLPTPLLAYSFTCLLKIRFNTLLRSYIITASSLFFAEFQRIACF